MIACVRGTVLVRAPDHVVIDCGGVGYRLSTSSKTLARVPSSGREVSLLSHLVVREDDMQLYGFAAEEERELFLRLISVAGVGPKMALAALSGSSARELARAIAAGDAKRFQVVPGIGRKTAERIIVELREKVGDELVGGPDEAPTTDARLLAREGLVSLGYELAEAEAMLEAVGEGVDPSEPEGLIAAALRGTVREAA